MNKSPIEWTDFTHTLLSVVRMVAHIAMPRNRDYIRTKTGTLQLQYYKSETILHAKDYTNNGMCLAERFQTRKQAVKYVIDNYSEILIEELLNGDIE